MADHVITPMVAHAAALDVFERMRKHPVIGPMLEKEKRTGFFFVFSRYRKEAYTQEDLSYTHELIGALVGDVPERLERYRTFAREKLSRVLDFSYARGDRTSRKSRDPDQQRWAGVVLGMRYGASVSGLPEDVDEILSAAVLYRIGDLTFDEVRLLLSNPLFNADDEEMLRIFRGGTH